MCTIPKVGSSTEMVHCVMRVVILIQCLNFFAGSTTRPRAQQVLDTKEVRQSAISGDKAYGLLLVVAAVGDARKLQAHLDMGATARVLINRHRCDIVGACIAGGVITIVVLRDLY